MLMQNTLRNLRSMRVRTLRDRLLPNQVCNLVVPAIHLRMDILWTLE